MVEGEDGLLELVDCPESAVRKLPTRLLGAFDPVLHEWTKRDCLIPSAEDRAVVTINGIFRPAIPVEGQVAGTWTMPAGKVELNPFQSLDKKASTAIEREVENAEAYLNPKD
ncbi:MAG: crosslink repair DNA glycosylase YcaQ family protein [Solirubrobacterales bacterium]